MAIAAVIVFICFISKVLRIYDFALQPISVVMRLFWHKPIRLAIRSFAGKGERDARGAQTFSFGFALKDFLPANLRELRAGPDFFYADR